MKSSAPSQPIFLQKAGKILTVIKSSEVSKYVIPVSQAGKSKVRVNRSDLGQGGFIKLNCNFLTMLYNLFLLWMSLVIIITKTHEHKL